MIDEVRRPYTTGPDRWKVAAVVSRHRTLNGALKALRRQQEAARRQGGFCLDGVVAVTLFGVTPAAAFDEE
jgi:hypothetical protein